MKQGVFTQPGSFATEVQFGHHSRHFAWQQAASLFDHLVGELLD